MKKDIFTQNITIKVYKNVIKTNGKPTKPSRTGLTLPFKYTWCINEPHQHY